MAQVRAYASATGSASQKWATRTVTTRASAAAARSRSCRPAAGPAASPDPAGERKIPIEDADSNEGTALEQPATRADRATVMQRGRAKAYRPLPAEERRAALRAGLVAYEQGYFFLAHETLEPAWMGTDDPGERDLNQGLIKLAAAFVHATRRNRIGIEKNLRGARELLSGGIAAGAREGIDVPRILAAIEDRLTSLERGGLGDPSAPAYRHHQAAVIAPIPIFTARSTPGDE